MVLTVSELRIAQEKKNNRITSMLRLRVDTSSFVIQCLADREIQKSICDGQSGHSKAYSYNCTVIHNPHAWSHFRAVNGHGWNTNSNQPFDPNLKVGKVFANQHSNKEQADNTQLDKKKLELLEASKFKVCQLEETIMILKEENAKIKQLYISNVSTNKNSNAPDNHQVLSLQQQIRAMNSNLEDKNQIIISLNATNGMLRFKLSNQIIFSEETIRNLKEENDKLKTLKWELERNNQMTQRLNDKIMILEADLAAEKNRTVGRVNGGMVDSATVYDVESHLESLPTSQSTLCKTCCVIM